MIKKAIPKKQEKRISQQEFEKEILKLVDKGFTAEKIGENLRKQGIHPKEYNKKISIILKENNKYIDPERKNTEEKAIKVKEHYEKNKQDKKAMREKDRLFAKLRKIKRYLKE
jgi:ribosomal protein S15P/S13E